MSELNNYFLTIDVEKAMGDLEKVEAKRDEVDKETRAMIKKIEEESRKAFLKAVNQMQRTWYATETILRTMGITVPQMMRTIISGVFGTIKAITPLLMAESVTGVMTAQAVFGMSQIALSIAAAIAAQKEQKQSEATFNDINTIVGTVNSYIGGFNF